MEAEAWESEWWRAPRPLGPGPPEEEPPREAAAAACPAAGAGEAAPAPSSSRAEAERVEGFLHRAARQRLRPWAAPGAGEHPQWHSYWSGRMRREAEQASAAAAAAAPPPEPAGAVLGSTPAAAEERRVRQGGRELVLRRLSREPAVWAVENLLSDEDCERLVAHGRRFCGAPEGWAPEQLGTARTAAVKRLEPGNWVDDGVRALVSERLRGLAPFGAEAGDVAQIAYTAPEPWEAAGEGAGKQSRLSIGLHLDTNHRQQDRFCTVLCYLNDVAAGGHTVFPCVDPRVADHGRRLAREGYRSTSDACDIRVEGDGVAVRAVAATPSAAALVEAAEASPAALRVRPRRGLGVVFFNMARPDAAAAAGEANGLSWHGGAAVTGDGTGEDGGAGGKWTLQAFLELPEDLKGAGNNARLKAVLDAVG